MANLLRLGCLCILCLSLISFSHKEKWDDNKSEWSPLMTAIYKGKRKAYTKLIHGGKDLDYITPGIKGGWQLTALDVAIRKGNENATKLLLETGKFPDLDEYLITACTGDNSKIIGLLFDHGASPHYEFETGHTPLMIAVSVGSPEVLVAFLDRDSTTINKQKKTGTTALMLAARNLDVKKVEILLQYKADKAIRDNDGKTAYDYLRYGYSDNKANVIEKLKALLRTE